MQITEPKLGCRTNVRAWHCAGCKVLHSNTSSRHALRRYACLRPQSCSTRTAPLEAARCACDNRRATMRASEMKTQAPSGSRGRAGVRISNLPPWLSLLCMVIYISVVETSPNHRRSRGGLPREAAEALFRVAHQHQVSSGNLSHHLARMVAERGPDLGGHHRVFRPHRNGAPHHRRLWAYYRRTFIDPRRLYPKARPRVHVRWAETLAPLDRGIPRRAAGPSHCRLRWPRGRPQPNLRHGGFPCCPHGERR